MSVHLSNQAIENLYKKIYPEVKAKGLSDRDADIITIYKIFPRSALCMANKYNMTEDEVLKVYDSYYGR